MRKHFLILMLMALLPLAGWAATFDQAQVEFVGGVPDYTYGQEDAMTLPTVKVTYHNGVQRVELTGAGVYQVAWSFKANGAADYVPYTAEAAVNAGEYKVTVTANTGDTFTWDGGYDGSLKFTVAKANIVTTGEHKDFNAPVAALPIYNDAAQALVTAGTWINGAKGTFQYAVKVGEAAYGDYSAVLPTGIKASDTYAVKYKIVGDANHNDVAEAVVEGVSIQKHPLTFIVGTVETTYGTATTMPAATAAHFTSINGIQGDDVLTYTLGLVEGHGILANTKPGLYNDKVTVSAIGGTDATEYVAAANANIVPGTLKINKKELSVKGNTQTKTYPATAGAVTYAFTGFIDDEADARKPSADNLTYTLVDAPTPLPANVISKQFINVNVSNVSSDYYKLTEDNTGYIQISKGTLIVSPNQVTKTYGEEDPELTYIVSPVSATDKVLNVTYERTEPDNENVGTYTLNITSVTLSDDVEDKYNVNYEGFFADFVIEKRPLNITIPSQTLALGDQVYDDNTNPELPLVGKFNITNFSVADGGLLPADGNPFQLSLATSATCVITDGKIGAGTTTGNHIQIVRKTSTDPVEDAALATLVNNYSGWDDVTGKLIVAGAGVIVLDVADAVAGITNNVWEAGPTQTVMFTSRRLVTDTWNAMVLPFDIEVADLSQKFGYCIVNTLNETTSREDAVRFNLYMGKIAAGTPFLIKFHSTAIDNLNVITIDDVKIVGTAINEKTADGGKVKFTGQYKRNASGDLGTNVVFPYNTADAGRWVESDGTAQIPGFSAYVIYPEKPSAAGSRIYVEDFENGATVIKQIGADGKAYTVDGWYTLNGVKLQGMPTEKGIYINNGKKVVVK